MAMDQNSHFMQAAQAVGDAVIRAVDHVGNAVVEHADRLIGGFMDRLTGMVESAGQKVTDGVAKLKDSAMALVPNKIKEPSPQPSKEKQLAIDTPPQPPISEHKEVKAQLAMADIKLPDLKMVDMDLGQHSVSPTHSRAAGMSGPEIGMGGLA
jgi:hypothetical protein